MLVYTDIRGEALIALDPDNFYVPRHSHAFEAIEHIVEAGGTPDIMLVADHLRRHGIDQPNVEELTRWFADAPGRNTAGQYIEIVAADARRRRMLALAGEAAERIYAGLDPTGLLEAIATTAPSQPAQSWEPINLATILENGIPELRPEWLVRADGRALLYPGKVHAFNGESETGKSWLSLIAIAHAVRSDRDGLILDFEDDANTAVERLAALSLDGDDLARIVYIRPEEALSDAGRARLRAACSERDIAVAVIDGVAEALSQNGWKENEGADIVAFYEALPRWLARQGPAVVLIDHVVKAKEDQGRYARGSGAKLAGVDGAVYKVETISPFGRGKSGRSRIVVKKDRIGWIRREAGAQHVVAELVVVSNPDGSHVDPQLVAPQIPSGAGFRPTGIMERCSRFLETQQDAQSAYQVNKCVPGKEEHIRIALRTLVDEGYVSSDPGARGATLHRSLKPFREHGPDDEPPRREEWPDEEEHVMEDAY